MDYQVIINKLAKELENFEDKGHVATYIPELGKISPGKFGICLITTNGKECHYGDWDEKFSIQSISKAFALALAYSLEEEKLWERVGVEPSGTPFNSLVQLEHDCGIPRNPFINAGAIVICDILISRLQHPKEDLLNFIHKLSGNNDCSYSPHIADSEKSTGYRNAALINLMKSFGNIHNPVDVVLDFYFNLCSIEMTCKELARTFLFLANYGVNPANNERIISVSKAKRINAIMQLCGFYDEAGEFAFKVGLPGKSGVGGGIIAIHPNEYSIALWSPKLNDKGNSCKGMEFLKRFTSETELSIF